MFLSLLKGVYRLFRCLREFTVSLFFILFVLVCWAVVSMMANSGKPQTSDLGQNSALLLKLNGYLADNRDQYGDFYHLLRSEMEQSEDNKISTFDVVQMLKRAAADRQITGLVLDLGKFQGGDIPSLRFIGEEINAFKQSGKPVIAVGSQFSQSQYYLATFADKIYLNKAGSVDLKGLSYSNLYFKSLLDKIEATPHIFRVGTYKSAVEPFLRDDMSPEARQNAQKWLGEMWDDFQTVVAKNRQIGKEKVLPEPAQFLAEYRKANGDDAKFALNRFLVSEVLSEGEIRQKLITQFGRNSQGSYPLIEDSDYVETLPDRFSSNASQKIAVVNVEGAIVDGESDEQSAGSETIVALLEKVNQDPNVVGLILRVNSPGGSAVASELIRQKVAEIQQKGVPVVASMGGMAASGGYWISATSDKIVADPSTITGSIGIFGLVLNVEKTAKKIGVSEDGIATSELANQNALKPLSSAQSEFIQIGIENGYDRFISLVSQGRKMSKEAVDKIAQGQVWTGETAQKLGLVDSLGDFSTAYDEVVALLEQQGKTVKSPAVQWFVEEDDSLFGAILKGVKPKVQVELVRWLNLPVQSKLKQSLGVLDSFNDPQNRYLYCLNCGVVR